MRTFLRMTESFLHGRGRFAPEAPFADQWAWLIIFVIVFGVLYGAVMGSFAGLAPDRWQQLLYSGIKVPMLLLATFVLCLPSFFVVNSVAGLRSDFPQALRGVVAAQACVTIVLAALAPLTALYYVSFDHYSSAVLFNGAMFAVASFTAQHILRRHYRVLIRRSPRHRQMLRVWLFFYVFVGIEMAWVLRPFVGDPNKPVAFFRQEAWGNAYVVVGSMMVRLLRQMVSL